MKIGIALLFSSALFAQQFPSNIEQLIRLYWTPSTSDAQRTEIRQDLVETDAQRSYLTAFAPSTAERPMETALALQRFRTDQQIGNASATTAATSVVAKTGVTEFLSAAFESGAVSRKAGGEAITFQFKALPLQQLLTGQKPLGCELAADTCTQGAGKFWNGLAGGVTFNQSNREIALPPALASQLSFLRDAGALSALSVRYEFVARRPKNELAVALSDAVKDLREKRGAELKAFLVKDSAVQTKLEESMQRAGFRMRIIDQLAKETTEAGFRRVLAAAYAEVSAAVSREEVESLRGLQEKVRQALNKARAEALFKKAVTLEYLHQRPVNQPQLSQLRAIVSTPLGHKPDGEKRMLTESSAMPNASLSFNFGATLYHHVDAAAQPGRLRDVQFSSALDFPLGKWGALGYAKATLAGYYQYMKENAVLQFGQDLVTPGAAAIPLPRPAVEVLGTKGHIGVAQFRLSVPLGDSGAAIPFAASWANRSELIKDPGWQAHIGITYDLGVLTKVLRGGN
jgi:phage tail tube protein FII